MSFFIFFTTSEKDAGRALFFKRRAVRPGEAVVVSKNIFSAERYVGK
jgi:hypothetical protein